MKASNTMLLVLVFVVVLNRVRERVKTWLIRSLFTLVREFMGVVLETWFFLYKLLYAFSGVCIHSFSNSNRFHWTRFMQPRNWCLEDIIMFPFVQTRTWLLVSTGNLKQSTFRSRKNTSETWGYIVPSISNGKILRLYAYSAELVFSIATCRQGTFVSAA